MGCCRQKAFCGFMKLCTGCKIVATISIVVALIFIVFDAMKFYEGYNNTDQRHLYQTSYTIDICACIIWVALSCVLLYGAAKKSITFIRPWGFFCFAFITVRIFILVLDVAYMFFIRFYLNLLIECCFSVIIIGFLVYGITAVCSYKNNLFEEQELLRERSHRMGSVLEADRVKVKRLRR